MEPQKIINTYKFRLKRAWNQAFLAQQMQNFLRQGGVQPPKFAKISLGKGVHVWKPPNHTYKSRLKSKKGVYLSILAHQN